MGRGIALQYKKGLPENFKEYKKACNNNEVQPGRMFVTEPRELNGPKYIINFPTKRHWRGKSRMEDIESGLTALVEIINDLNIRSIAIPPLGSGLGGLYWSEVRTRMEQVLEPFADVEVRVYKPGGTPSTDKMVKTVKYQK